MKKLDALLENNQGWCSSINKEHPSLFSDLARQQKPEVLWIGCSDSRVPANQIVNALPGELFVHRNIANVVPHSDLNCLSVIQYAVEVLKVQHIIVCGHYACGGVQAALSDASFGLIDNWIAHIKDVREKYSSALSACEDEDARLARLCELNAIEQAKNVCKTSVVQQAWDTGASLTVHALIYNIAEGKLKNLNLEASAKSEVDDHVAKAIAQL